MQITIEPKEIAEIIELLARSDSAKKNMQKIKDRLPELTDKISEELKCKSLADVTLHEELNGNYSKVC